MTDARRPGLLASGAQTLATQAAALALAFATGILTARWLGPDGKGHLAVLMAFAGGLATLASLSVDQALVNLARKEPGRHGELLSTASLLIVLPALAVLGGVAALAWLRPDVLPGIAPPLVLLAACGVPFILARRILQGSFLAAGRMTAYNALGLGDALGTLLLLGIAATLVPASIAFALAASLVPTALIGLGLTRLRPRPREATREAARGLLGYALRYHGAAVAQFLSYRIDLFLVLVYLTPTEVGLYSVAVTIAELAWLVSSPIVVVLFPVLSGSAQDEAARIASLVSRVNVLLTGAAAAFLFVVGGPLLVLAYGERFAPSVPALALLLPGTFLLGVARVLANYLAGRGRPEIASLAALLAVAVDAAANVVLLPRMGIRGAAIASTLAYALTFVVVAAGFTRLSGLPLRDALLPRRSDAALLVSRLKDLLARARP